VGGGIVIDVDSGETIAHGLCMPHSPRLHQGRLYVLDSGRGHLCTVDRRSGELTTVAALPGYARGLTFHGRFAFVGLSKIREKDFFGGMPIAEQYGEAERRCGVCAVDLDTGALAAFLWFEAGTAEIFDLRVLPGPRWPTVVGFQGDTLDGIMIAPPGAWAQGATLPGLR